MWTAYRAADVFLAPAPAMNMPELDNYRATGPIARRGVRNKSSLLERLGLDSGTRLVMVALGGIATTLPLVNWPRIDKVAWLFSTAVALPRDDLFDLCVLPLSFIDVLASVDAVLTKPGYGTYTEAVCNGVPLLTLSRPDWPETSVSEYMGMSSRSFAGDQQATIRERDVCRRVAEIMVSTGPRRNT